MFQLFVVLPISWKLEAVDRTLLDGVLSLGYEVERKKKRRKFCSHSDYTCKYAYILTYMICVFVKIPSFPVCMVVLHFEVARLQSIVTRSSFAVQIFVCWCMIVWVKPEYLSAALFALWLIVCLIVYQPGNKLKFKPLV